MQISADSAHEKPEELNPIKNPKALQLNKA
jgi:hypothetical protein